MNNLLYRILRKSRVLLESFQGLDFSSVIQPEEVGLDPNIAFRSSPSGNKYLKNLLKDLKITGEDSIIDVGCGKGSAMRTMLKFPFARVDGLELSEHIANIAIRNFEKLKVNNSRVFICDASVYKDYAAYNMVYFYNPFPGEIMYKVIHELLESLKSLERELIIIYYNPVCHDLFTGQGAFSKIGDYPGEHGNRIYVYSNRDVKDSRSNCSPVTASVGYSSTLHSRRTFSLSVKKINTIEQFYFLKKSWNDLLDESANDNIFLTWEWLYSWWETYSKGKELYTLLFYGNNGHFIGIAPFYITYEKILGIPIRVLKLIGSEEVCSEYLDVIALKDRRNEVINSIADYLLMNITDYDIFYFKDICEGSIIKDVSILMQRSENIVCKNKIRTTNPFILLPENGNVFYENLSSNGRRAIKDIIRREKKLSNNHEVSYLTVNGEKDLEAFFEIFVTLHQKLWESRGLPGMFKRKRFVQFHSVIAKRFAENDWVRLYFISINGKPVASLYGFVYQDKFYYYQSGFDPDWRMCGVGKILVNHTIQEAIRNKLKEYDFLRGEGSYKYDFTEQFRQTWEIIAARDTYKAKIYLSYKEMRKLFTDTLKKISPETLVTQARKIRDHIVLR